MKGTLKERARLYIDEHPLLFYSFHGLRPKYRGLMVNRKTQLVIEGFPRSGNTFTVVACEYAQPEEIKIAHHLHAPAQVILAARWRIPALVLLREPAEAALSLVVREPEISIRQALSHYISFYETVARYREAYVLGTFEEIISDYGAVIEKVNARFGTRFSTFVHTEDSVEAVFSLIEKQHRARRKNVLAEEQISRPSAAKRELKDSLREGFESPEIKALAVRATSIHGALAESANRD